MNKAIDDATLGKKNNKWLVLLSIGIGTFMAALDGSVVNVALPTITASFGSHVNTTEWIVTVYLLVLSCLLLAFGRLGDIQGHKRVYVSGFVIFGGASFLCVLASEPWMLIGARGIQAIGAAMLSANSPAILTGNFPGSQRGQALGLQATLTYLGLSVGPSLGGWMTQHLGWHSVFLINVPVSVLALFFSLRFIPNDRLGGQHEVFDWRGALIFMSGLVLFIFVLNRGQEWGWLTIRSGGLLLLAVIILYLFVIYEKHSDAPMLDLSLFQERTFFFSTLSAFLNYASLFGIIFLMPFYLIQGRGFSPSQAGLILTAQPIMMALVAPVSGYLSDHVSPRWLATIGMAVLSLGLGLLSALTQFSGTHQIVIALMVTGFGTGMFISPNNNVLLGSAPKERQGIASGILATARNVGMVSGVGLIAAIYTTLLRHGPFTSEAANLFPALQWSFRVAALLAAIGIFTSFLRGSNDRGLDAKSHH
ncbi:MAG: hypothetical protein BGO78_12685 [Chloroflexi bacterium 44-23]|nr:MAG: hypothetical protein BGO78_12685 [Chloroflexi bacterium 44-23]